MRIALLSAVLVMTAVLALPGQQRPAPTFRVEVNYVEIDAVVTDGQGQFVRNLTKDDFELVEDGTPQTITAFTMVDLPVVKADPPLLRGATIEPDVQTNVGDFNGRVFLIVLDALQTDFRRSPLVRAAAKQFVRRFVGVNDLVAVAHSGSSAASGQEFTSSQPRLLAAIDRFAGQKLRRSDVSMDVEKAFKASNSLRVLRASAEFLSNVRGRRKAVVWFSEGIDYDIEGFNIGSLGAGGSQQGSSGSEIRDDMRNAIAAATRAGVSFYGIDARGLGAGLDDAIDAGPLDSDVQAGSGMARVMDETRRSQDFLRTLSSETGGFALVNQNDLNGGFAKIIQQNSSYYLLGYYPANDKRDGKVRGVQVRVTRPGLQVKSRTGYIAPKGKPAIRETPAAVSSASPRLREALDSPIPVSGLGLRVFAAPFSGPSKKASVAIIVEIDPGRLAFTPTGTGVFAEDVEVIILPVNAAGKALDGARDQAPLRLSQRSYDTVRAYGFRMTRRLDLPPGRYQLHVAAQASNGNAVGSLAFDLEVPDFTRQPLMMSGIALMAASAARLLTPPPDPSFTDVLPVAATAIRDFPSGDTLSMFAEVYDNRLATPHAVEIKTTVTSDDGDVLLSTSDTRRTDEITAKGGGFGHALKIPLAGYKPGRYVLRVEARASLANGGSAARELEFRVR